MSTITVTLETVTDDERRIERTSYETELPDLFAPAAYDFIKQAAELIAMLYAAGKASTDA